MAHYYAIVRQGEQEEVARFTTEKGVHAVSHEEDARMERDGKPWWKGRFASAFREEARKAMRRRVPGLKGHWHPVPGVEGCEIYAECSPRGHDERGARCTSGL